MRWSGWILINQLLFSAKERFRLYSFFFFISFDHSSEERENKNEKNSFQTNNRWSLKRERKIFSNSFAEKSSFKRLEETFDEKKNNQLGWGWKNIRNPWISIQKQLLETSFRFVYLPLKKNKFHRSIFIHNWIQDLFFQSYSSFQTSFLSTKNVIKNSIKFWDQN